jgi:hypothetical protein
MRSRCSSPKVNNLQEPYKLPKALSTVQSSYLMVACWPTRINPLAEIILPPFVSEWALDYKPLIINLSTDNPQQLCLITLDALSTEEHCRQTSRHSVVTNPPVINRWYQYLYPLESVRESPDLEYPILGPSTAAQLYSPPARMPWGPPPPTLHPPWVLGPAFANEMGTVMCFPLVVVIRSQPRSSE